MDNNNDSGANTVLIVIILLVLVGFGVWWFTMRGTTAPANSGTNIDIQLPTGDGWSGGGTTTPPAN